MHAGSWPRPLHVNLFSTVTAFLFDVDGTLVDSNAAHADTWAQALTEHGYPRDAGQVRPLIGMGGDKLLPTIAGVTEDSPPGRAIGRRKAELFAERRHGLLQTPGAGELIAYLRAEHKTVIVATSAGREEMRALLDQIGLASLLPARTSKEDVEESKPAPDIVVAALEQAGVSADRAIMIGDTPYDVAAAGAAGVRTIALRCGGGWSDASLSGAAAIFDDPRALLAQLRCERA